MQINRRSFLYLGAAGLAALALVRRVSGDALTWPNGSPFTLGVAAGCPRPSGFVLWTGLAGAGTADLTGSKCTPNTVQWTYDTWALANATGSAIVKEGGKSWFFITADYSFGHALEIAMPTC